eukprot:TRINITY_DN6343_c0_g1_i1.p1 TRINITY_DN6343_c0_g1~~TRINITY_DN6343_c0_g1_i1.p1  ORF type:complete len:298 (-),score=66.65 TRINITY_DN6343_c0_g1_i1:310-1203(-)
MARLWRLRAAASAAVPLGTLACAHLYQERRRSSLCDHQPHLELPALWLASTQGRLFPAVAQKKSQEKRIWRLAYLSHVRGDATSASRKVELTAEEFSTQSEASSISGHMCYDPNTQQVWHVLEGAPAEISAAWSKIKKATGQDIVEDSVRFEDDVEERRFASGWGFSNFGRSDCTAALRSSIGATSGNLVQLKYKAYVSPSTDGAAKDEKDVVARTIQESQLDVTGLLLFNDNSLTSYQVLEGRDSDVEQLWDALKQDPRQHIVSESVSLRGVTDRQFEGLAVDEVQRSRWSVGPGY